MSQQTNLSQFGLKKSAFRNKIRRQWLENYFQQRRGQLMRTQIQKYQQEQILNVEYEKVFQKLPSSQSIDSMIIFNEQNKGPLLKYVRKNIRRFIQTMKQLNLKAFSHYIFMLNSVMILYPQTCQEILSLGLRRVINQGKRLLNEEKIVSHFILQNMIEFILLISNKFSLMDQLMVTEVSDVLTSSFDLLQMYDNQEEIKKNYVRTMDIINQFLIASVKGLDEQQDQENIQQNEQRDLDYIKTVFINKIFMQNKKIFSAITRKVSYFNNDEKVTEITMRVLTNLTYFTCELAIYQSIIESQIQYLVFSVLQNFARKEMIIVLLIRLLNNLLMYSKDITAQIIEEISIKLLVSLFNKQKEGKITLVEQMCEFFSHIIYFMEEENKVIQYLIDKNVVEVLIYGLEHITKSHVLSNLLFCFPFMIRKNKSIITRKIRQHDYVFRKIVDEGDQQNQSLAENLLEQAYKQNTIEDYQPNSNYSGDIQI